MASRAQLIAELASNHGGDVPLLQDMIAAAADSGADFVKLQLYDAAMLRDDDPQKAWLTLAQVDRRILDIAIGHAAKRGVKLTASVFGIPQAQMARDAGLTTIKIGSGEIERLDLLSYCQPNFERVFVSHGLQRLMTFRGYPLVAGENIVPFYGVSQYPTPYFRGLAALHQKPVNTGYSAWGWSCHGENIEVCKEAALHGATYVERHFSMPFAKRISAWDSDAESFRELRDFADECAWEGTAEHQAACDKFLTRWSSK